MAVTIRLARQGAKKKPQYLVVALDSARKRDGVYLENLGHYFPKAKEAKDKIIGDAKDQAKAEANKIIIDAQHQIEQQKNAALTEVKNEIGSLALEVAEKILRKQLNASEGQDMYMKMLAEDIKLN